MCLSAWLGTHLLSVRMHMIDICMRNEARPGWGESVTDFFADRAKILRKENGVHVDVALCCVVITEFKCSSLTRWRKLISTDCVHDCCGTPCA